jgi:hypothetical protein
MGVLLEESAAVIRTSGVSRDRFLRYSVWDGVFVALAVLHGVLLLALPVLPVVAIGVWWNSNTISHNFIHRPFFRIRALNTLFSLYLSVILGIPQSIWKARHLAHHADVPWRLRITPLTVVEVSFVAALWGLLITLTPWFFLTVYVPGYLLGLALCYVHGYFEHADGTISHYGSFYNGLFFNDGYHIEHHANPGTHWTTLPSRVASDGRVSRWPAILRWLEYGSLDSLERLVLRSPRLQQFVLNCHERAFRRLLPRDGISRVAIVGGGLFPRTAMVLQRLLPHAQLVVIDASAENLRLAQESLPQTIERIHAFYDPARHCGFDLVVIPLAYVGDRAAFYRKPAAPHMIVHDWLWRPRGQSTIVSWLLLKRVNLVRSAATIAEKLAEQSHRLCRY